MLFELHEARQLQSKEATSSADALNNFIGPVPQGKFWTILYGRQHCSVSETRNVWWVIWSSIIGAYPITNPVSKVVSTVLPNALCTEGMTVLLFQGEYIASYRDIATAGSTILTAIRYIESDLPYYSYVEPVRKLVTKRGSRIVQALTGGAGAAFTPSSSHGSIGGGRDGGPEPV